MTGLFCFCNLEKYYAFKAYLMSSIEVIDAHIFPFLATVRLFMLVPESFWQELVVFDSFLFIWYKLFKMRFLALDLESAISPGSQSYFILVDNNISQLQSGLRGAYPQTAIYSKHTHTHTHRKRVKYNTCVTTTFVKR